MQFIVMLALMLIMELTRPVPKPPRRPGLGDFTAPTAEQDRPIPKFWGKPWLSGPNLVWYGDLRIKKITVKIKGLFKSKKQTIGYEYHVGMHLVFGIGNDNCRLLKICVGGTSSATGGDIVWSGNMGLGTSSINKPNLWGGKEEGGGLVGNFTFMPGSRSQGQNSYLRSVLGSRVPAFRGVCGISWNRGYHGTRTVLENWAAQIENLPRAVSAPHHNVNGEANFAEVQYDLLTDSGFGLGLTADEIDVPSFAECAQKLHAEGLGGSPVWDNAKDLDSMLKEVDRHVGSMTFFSATKMKWRMKLIRADYDIDALPKVTKKNAKLIRFNRPTADELVNEMIVTYSSDEYQGKTIPVRVQDTAAFQNRDNQRVTATQAYPFITKLNLAKTLCARDLRDLSYPFARLQLELNREFSDVEQGDRLNFNWEFPDGAIENMPIIVLERNIGTQADGKITVTAAQDVFGLGAAIYTEGGSSGWTPIDREAKVPTVYRVEFSPWWLLKQDPDVPAPTAAVPMLMVEAPNSAHLSYSLQYTDPSLGGVFTYDEEPQAFTPTATLVYDYLESAGQDNQGTLIVSGLTSISELSPVTANDLRYLGEGLFIIDSEILGYTSYSARPDGTVAFTGVKRALLDTTQERHLAGAKAWFISEALGRTPTQLVPFASGNYRAKIITKALASSIDVSLAPTVSISTNAANQNARPLYAYPVRDLKVNGSNVPGKVPANLISLSWAHSNKEAEDRIYFQDDTPPPKPGDTWYVAYLYDDLGVLKASSGMLFGTTHNFAVGDVVGGLPTAGYVQVATFNTTGSSARATLWFGREVDYANTQDAAPQRFLDEAGPWTFIRMSD